ncbi:hypothetical protein [Gimesia panareensis]|nr:hypothetical protein [Gimesia panareensis]
MPEEMNNQSDLMDKISIQISEGITISTQLSETEAAQIEGVEQQDMQKGGYVWYRLPVVEVDEHRMIFSLAFYEGKLREYSIALVESKQKDGSWNDWSESEERLRAEAIAAWLRDKGYAARVYPWGEVWVGYDPQTGAGCAHIGFFSFHLD